MEKDAAPTPTEQLEENMKKAVTELLILTLLSRKESYIGELTDLIHSKSRNAFCLIFPYSAIYRLERQGYICETAKRVAPDGRRRQYFAVTEAGRRYLEHLLRAYQNFVEGVSFILEEAIEK